MSQKINFPEKIDKLRSGDIIFRSGDDRYEIRSIKDGYLMLKNLHHAHIKILPVMAVIDEGWQVEEKILSF
jgi:hypothetical protein